MSESGSLTCQDWYRVRRGEDEIVWGKAYIDPQLPNVLFSRRSSHELAFLTTQQKRMVRECLRQLSSMSPDEQGVAVLNGGSRRLAHVDQLRIVFRFNADSDQLEISTIRGGPVLDPENVGPVRRSGSIWGWSGSSTSPPMPRRGAE